MMEEEIPVNEVEAMKSGGQQEMKVEEEMSVTKVTAVKTEGQVKMKHMRSLFERRFFQLMLNS